MIIYSLILFVLLVFIFIFYNYEHFLGNNNVKNVSNEDCAYFKNKETRRLNNLFLEDLSKILKTKRKNNALRDVNELMFYKDDINKNIYDYTSVNTDKKYINELDFW